MFGGQGQIDVVGQRRWFDDVGRWAAERPGDTAVEDDTAQAGLTFGELWSLSGRIAAGLRQRGMQPGDAVLLYLRNSVMYPALLLGLHRCGLVAVLASPWNKADEVAYQIADAGCRMVITDSEGADVAARAGEAAKRRGRQPVLIVTDDEDLARAAAFIDDGDVTPDMRATLLYTSGTTGRPKGAVFAHGNYVFHGEVSQHLYGYGPWDVGLNLFPLSLAHGHFYQLVTWLMAGMRMVVRPFTASGFPGQVLRHGITVTSLNATHMKMIASRASPDTQARDQLRFVKMGLDLPVDDAATFERTFGGPLVRSYSQTESVGPVLSWRPGNRRLDSVGLPVLGYEVSVADESRRLVATGQAGELAIRSAHPYALFQGYQGHGLSIKDGWWLTGDLVRRRQHGDFEFVGRTTDVIKRSGFSISAAEVERAIREHPAVSEVAVVGMPDPVREEEVRAFVVTRATVSPEELLAHCSELIADYKVPQVIELVADLPRTAIGKVDKKQLVSSLSPGSGSS